MPLNDVNTVDAPLQERGKSRKKLNRAYLRDRKPPQNGYSTESGHTCLFFSKVESYIRSAKANEIRPDSLPPATAQQRTFAPWESLKTQYPRNWDTYPTPPQPKFLSLSLAPYPESKFRLP